MQTDGYCVYLSVDMMLILQIWIRMILTGLSDDLLSIFRYRLCDLCLSDRRAGRIEGLGSIVLPDQLLAL